MSRTARLHAFGGYRNIRDLPVRDLDLRIPPRGHQPGAGRPFRGREYVEFDATTERALMCGSLATGCV